MKRMGLLLLILFMFIGLLFFTVSGKGEKVQDIKKKDLTIQTPGIKANTGAVQVDLNVGKFPLYFIFNKGQVNQKAKFYARASRYTLWLTKEGLVFDSTKRQGARGRGRGAERHTPAFGHPSQEGITYLRDVSRFMFIGANKNPGIVPIKKTKLRVNYFKGNDPSKWHGDIPTSQAVLYKNLYKKIDLKVYGIEKQIEYDWSVKPGGKPEDIRFEYKNVKGTRLDNEGNLLIETDFGELIHKKPVSYQRPTAQGAGCGVQGVTDTGERVEIDVTFKKIDKNTYGFQVGKYDKRFELIIDPVVLAYSTYLGGSQNDGCTGISVDNSGYIYVTGGTLSTDFPTRYQYQVPQVGEDCFVAKLDLSQGGVSGLIYSTYLGGGDADCVSGIAVDDNGNAYVTGSTESTNFPTRNQYQTDQPRVDGFITVLDTTLSGTSSLVYSTYIGGESFEYSFGIAVDDSGNAYVTGETNSADFPVMNQFQAGHIIDVFVTRINTTRSGALSLVYSTFLGSTGYDTGRGIAVDGSGNAYVTGITWGPDFPLLDHYQTYQGGWGDAFVTKLDTTRSGASSLIYSTYLGGEVDDYGYGIAVDDNGNAFVTGETHSSTFPTLNQFQDVLVPLAGNAFVTRLDTTRSGAASLIYSTYLGGESLDSGVAIATDGSGNAYVTGYTWGKGFPIRDPYPASQITAGRFITKLDTNQSGDPSLIFSTFLASGIYTSAITVDGNSNIYVAGYTYNPDLPTINSFQTYQGGNDTFVAKLIYKTPPVVITTPVSSITSTSARSGGEVTSEGDSPVIARGICWSTSENPTIADNYTVDGSGIGIFNSSMTGLTLHTVYYARAYATSAAATVYGNEEKFTTLGLIDVTSPNGGENWETGSLQQITWTSQGVGGNVKIEYSTDNGGTWTEIIASSENDGSFDWTIPGSASDQCLIRISEVGGSASDISDEVFSIFSPAVTVTSPNGGELWQINSQQTITWTSIGTVGNVKIEYSPDQGFNWTEITPSTENDGSHPWILPDTASNECLIRISEIDGSPSDSNDYLFSIIPLPYIRVTSPNGGEQWQVNSWHPIRWSRSGIEGNVKIELSTDNGGNWTVITSDTKNNGYYSWVVPEAVSSQCLIRVSEIDGSLSDTSDSVFSIVQNPEIKIENPNGGEKWAVNSQQKIEWTSTGVPGNVKIEYSTNSGGHWVVITSSTSNNGYFYWTIPAVLSHGCLIRVSNIDGSVSDKSNSVFSIVPEPIITVTVPNGGEVWPQGSYRQIKWENTGVGNYIKIEYSLDNGSNWTVLTPSTSLISYSWRVDTAASDNCLIRVSDASGSSSSDTSDGVFSIIPPPVITVTSPQGGEQWEANSLKTITWTTIGTVGDMKIEYTLFGDSPYYWTEIIAATENDGTYDWTVPVEFSNQCKIRVSDTVVLTSGTSDGMFAIVPVPDVTVTAPNGGESWTGGEIHTITWTSTGIVGIVMIEYSTNGGTSWQMVSQAAENSGQYNWTVPNVSANNCLIRIKASDGDTSRTDISDAAFSITSTVEPMITVTSPNGGEALNAGTIHEVKWTATGVDQVPNVFIDYSRDRGTTWKTIIPSIANAANGSFYWRVPNTPSQNCVLRVMGVDRDDAPSDTSDATFSIASPSSPSIAVVSPNGGETWWVGFQQTITWNTFGTVDNVKIEYSAHNGESWTEIIASTPNTGRFVWTAADTPSDNCLVRVSAGDTGDNPSDTSDAFFSIGSPPSLTLISPNGHERWQAGTTQPVTWDSVGIASEVKIEYSADGGESWKEISKNAPNNGSFDWVIPKISSARCLVRISGKDIDSNESWWDKSDALFSIGLGPDPYIIVTSPNGGEALYAGANHEIQWSASDKVGNLTISYSLNGGETWTEIIGSTDNDGGYEWTVPDNTADNCLVRVGETDGEPLDISDAVFSIITPPEETITVTSPNGGETWMVGTTYEINWSSTGAIDEVTIEYSADNGTTWTTIVDSAVNKGWFDWTVPHTPSVSCQVRIRGNDGDDQDGEPSDVGDEVFSIVLSSPSAIRVVSPNGGVNLETGSEFEITWTSTGLETVNIEYSTNNGATWNFVASASATEGSYLWTVPDTPSEKCLVRIRGGDTDQDPVDVSDALFSIVSN